MKLYHDATGPLVTYNDGYLRIADLNPERELWWRMSRWEMLLFGLRAALASIRPFRPLPSPFKLETHRRASD